MRTMALLVACFISLHAYAAPGLSGEWRGSGTIDIGFESTKARFEISIRQEAKALHIRECWFKPERPLQKGCITSDYELADESTILYQGNRIGDIYDRSIRLLIADPQVSEQMVFELSSEGSLQYRYSYANFDGDTIYRKAVLEKE
jgi:hypothetical protein